MMLMLPHRCEGLRVRRMPALCPFRRPFMGRPVPCQLMRNALLDLTTIVPATACHRRSYAERYSRFIQHYDGHIAQLLGDGLLVYLGYPQAHEDDAQRAVRTGLGILAAVGDLNQDLHQAKGIQLAIRVGIHTGLVVVGAMGDQGRQEQLALGLLSISVSSQR
jgi:hypothetical protein